MESLARLISRSVNIDPFSRANSVTSPLQKAAMFLASSVASMRNSPPRSNVSEEQDRSSTRRFSYLNVR